MKPKAYIAERDYCGLEIRLHEVDCLRQFSHMGYDFFIYRANKMLFCGEKTTGKFIVKTGNSLNGIPAPKTLDAFVAFCIEYMNQWNERITIDSAIKYALESGFNVQQLKENQP